MSAIKKGDLVMIKAGPNKRHCTFAGQIATTVEPFDLLGLKTWSLSPTTFDLDFREIVWPEKYLKKIDPPSTGEYDRVPVRKKQPKEVTA